MQRLSIARSLRLALLGLTVALAVIAALGVASLYTARQRYEKTLVQSASLATAAANLGSASIAEEDVFRDARGARDAGARRQGANGYASAAARALSIARGDPASERLVHAQQSAEAAARRLALRGSALSPAAAGAFARARTLAAELQARQRLRQSAARRSARSESRRAVTLVAVAGILALLAALTLVTALVRTMRRPLDDLVRATRSLAAGERDHWVQPAGPRELQELGTAFNTMAAELAGAQRRIEAERLRLAVTIESLGDGLIVTEPESAVVAAVNPRAAELVPELTPGSDAHARESPLPPLEDAIDSETVIEHRGRMLAVTAAALGSESDGIVWTVRDITDRARLERAKSDFVATASHELRSPLTSIKGFVELLERSPENMSARQREFVQIILKSTDRLVDLVNDLLDVARIEAQHVDINRRPIDVGEAVREVTELMGPRIEEKRQQLNVKIAPVLPLALADPARVRQIVANLLTNAHQYTDKGGTINVAVEADRAWVQIAVQDSGVGMTAEESAHAFERFFRGRNGSSLAPGTGLGLSIVKSLVELHHGQIEVSSEPGRGTRFTVLLPATVPASEAAGSPESMRGRRVLIVDDERDIAELIAGQLAPLDVRTTIAENGQQALELLRTEPFDAVTLDILMPGMDGFEVLRQIRGDPELQMVPVVCVSVFAGRQELAGEWVVSKPIDADELRDVVGAAVNSGRSRVLVVGREEMRGTLQPALAELGIEHQWELTSAAAQRVCRERRFEVALVDVGVRNPSAVLQALDLRGRRVRRAVILFSDGQTPAPPGIGRLGMEVVPLDEAAAAVSAALHAEQPA